MDEYAAAGVDFAAYNSVENAADIDGISEVIGYDQIVLYGDSYGTVLSQHVMRDFPDTLAAVILDGVDTLSAPSWVTQEEAEFQSALETVIRAVRGGRGVQRSLSQSSPRCQRPFTRNCRANHTNSKWKENRSNRRGAGSIGLFRDLVRSIHSFRSAAGGGQHAE